MEAYLLHFIVISFFSRQFVVKIAGATGVPNRQPSILSEPWQPHSHWPEKQKKMRVDKGFGNSCNSCEVCDLSKFSKNAAVVLINWRLRWFQMGLPASAASRGYVTRGISFCSHCFRKIFILVGFSADASGKHSCIICWSLSLPARRGFLFIFKTYNLNCRMKCNAL